LKTNFFLFGSRTERTVLLRNLKKYY